MSRLQKSVTLQPQPGGTTKSERTCCGIGKKKLIVATNVSFEVITTDMKYFSENVRIDRNLFYDS